MNYLDQLAKFHLQHGTNLNRFPSVDKRPLDLYKLKKAVEARGGFEAVCKLKKWAEIGRDLGYSGKIMSSLSTSLKNSYQRWLQPYEEYLRIAKPGVQQQLELEQGGPFTPSPRQSPMYPKPSFGNRYVSKSQQGSPAVSTPTMDDASKTNDASGKQTSPQLNSQPAGTGFTAVNSNSGNGFVAVNQTPPAPMVNNAPAVKREIENGSPAPRSVAEHPPTSTPISNGNGSHPLKRGVSRDSTSGGSQTENGEDGGSGRRSKRLKKGMFQKLYDFRVFLSGPSRKSISTRANNLIILN